MTRGTDLGTEGGIIRGTGLGMAVGTPPGINHGILIIPITEVVCHPIARHRTSAVSAPITAAEFPVYVRQTDRAAATVQAQQQTAPIRHNVRQQAAWRDRAAPHPTHDRQPRHAPTHPASCVPAHPHDRTPAHSRVPAMAALRKAIHDRLPLPAARLIIVAA